MSTLTPTTPTADSHAAGAILGKLFDEHGRMVLGVCRIYLHDEYEAEDAAQETFVSAHRSVLSGRHPEQAGAWLAAIARNECRDRLRRDVRRNTTSAPAEMFERIPAAHAACVADEIDQGASLQNALADLPESQREAFVLREMLGLRYDEIAKALDTTQSAVESLLVRARRGLQDHLRPLRLIPIALVVPFALRESVGHAVLGFPVGAASSTTIATGSGTLLASTSGQAGTSAATTSGAGATSASGMAASGGTTGIGIGTGAGAAATTAASTVAAVTSVPALAGVAKMMVVPILAKLAVAGAATTVVATMAVSKPWNVETKQTQATPAAEVSQAVAPENPEPGAGPEAALVSIPGSAVGDGSAQGVADGKGAAKGKTPRRGKNKGAGNGAAESDAKPVEKPGDAQTPSAAVAAATQDAGETPSAPPAETAESQSSPPDSAETTSDANGVATGQAGDERSKNGSGNGATKAAANNSSSSHAAAGAGAAQAAKGKGKKRGHEADGPGGSNDAPGKNKKASASGKAPAPKGPDANLDASKSLSPSIGTPDDKDGKKKGNEKHDTKGSGKAGPTGSGDAE
jgi:RNA polymerase sigma-70 factor (ECF subfamily)